MPTAPHKHVLCPVLVLGLEMPEVADEELAEQLRDELLSCFRALRPLHVVLDLHKVKSLDSNAFRPLLSLLREIRTVGGRLLLCRMNADVREVLAVTHLISPDGVAPAPFEAEEDLGTSLARLGLASPCT
jgi:anti-anti-sigma factor